MTSIPSENKSIELCPPSKPTEVTPLVDVNLIAYNHEKFIAKAIESVLEQQTRFSYRLIIGDDCSTDATPEIIKDYAQRFPERITVILSPEHRGVNHAERIGIQVLRMNRAPYVALLDGDDYWIDPCKLQKQVDFLESHPDFSICFHNAKVVSEDGSTRLRAFSPPNQKPVSTLEDLLARNFIFTGSTMFRNHLFGEIPEWFHTCLTGDWTLHLLNAQYGKVGYLNEEMAAYRLQSRGLWTLTDRVAQARDRIKILEHLEDYVNVTHRRQVRNARSYAFQNLSEVYYQRGELSDSRRALMTSLNICRANRSIPNRHLLTRLIKLEFYALLDMLRIRRASQPRT